MRPLFSVLLFGKDWMPKWEGSLHIYIILIDIHQHGWQR